jgi:hypothetical protein
MNIPRWLRWRSHAEMDEEIDAHLELEVQAHLDRGLSREEAYRAARRRFGNLSAVKQQARENDPLFRLETLVTDVRQTGFAGRRASRSPRF